MRALWNRASIGWCRTFHPKPLWPVHRQYRCRACLRAYPMPSQEGGTLLTKPAASQAAAPVSANAYTCGPSRSGSFLRDALLSIGLMGLLIPASASAQRIPMPIVQSTTNEGIAFARYIAWLHAPDPFTESGPVALAITASLPGLNKQGSLLAIREVGESERSEYGVIGLEGDAVVFQRVIAPYLVAERQVEDLPLSSVLITPRNYKFRYVGVADTGDSAAYIFRITPKKSRAGLIRGELWIEPVTGAPILVSGQFVKTPTVSDSGINVVREITFADGRPFARTTHVSIETRPVGRADLTIIESPLGSDPVSPGDPITTPSTSSVTEEPTSPSKRWP